MKSFATKQRYRSGSIDSDSGINTTDSEDCSYNRKNIPRQSLPASNSLNERLEGYNPARANGTPVMTETSSQNYQF
jgi:hypothetical protein